MNANTIALAIFCYIVLAALAFLAFSADCEAEDSNWCYWNAQTMGNGAGQSFIATWDNGPVFYINK